MVRRVFAVGRRLVGLLLVLLCVMVLAGVGLVGLAQPAAAQSEECVPLPLGASGLIVPGSAIFPLITWDVATNSDWGVSGYAGFHWGQYPLMVPPGYEVSIQVNLEDRNCGQWPMPGEVTQYRTDWPDAASGSYYRPEADDHWCTSHILGWQITSVTVCAKPPQGTIVVRKVGGPDPVSFTRSGGWSGGFDVSAGADWSSGPLLVGSYGVSEVVPEGWALTGASCDDGQDPAAILLKKDRTVTCTFTNTRDLPRIIVRTVGGPGPVTFTQSGDWEGSFQMLPGTEWNSGVIVAGSYGISEVVPQGWSQVKALCDGGRDPASFVLAENEAVVCTFTNVKNKLLGEDEAGSLTIIKRTVPAGGSGFSFDAGPLGSFTLDDGGTQTILDLAPGVYTVTEISATDGESARVECDAVDYAPDGASVTVNLTEGEEAVCTFTTGELPYTGPSVWLLPLFVAGLTTTLLGLGACARSRTKEADRV
jgi:hypothetical protein